MTPEEIKRLIEAGLEDCQAIVEGDGTHFQAIVISPAFEGLSLVRQHQLVYQTLGDRMQNQIHALSIQAFTPGQWEQAQGLRVL